MVENLDSKDDTLLEAVKALTPKSYIGYVDQIVDFPWPHRLWHRCHIEFVGQGLPTNAAHPFIEPSMCVPIFPNTHHPMSRTPLNPSSPFPFDNCYQYSLVETTVRVLTRLLDPDSAISLPPADIRYQHACEVEDFERLEVLRNAHNLVSPRNTGGNEVQLEVTEGDGLPKRLSSGHETDEGTNPSPHESCDDANRSIDDAKHDTNSSGELPRGLAAREHEENQVTSAREYNSSRDKSDSETPSSEGWATESGVTSNGSVLSLANMIFGEKPIADPDIIPLVHVSHDLSEVTEVADPNDFLAEEKVIVQLIQEARARDRRTFFSVYDENMRDAVSEGPRADRESVESECSNHGSDKSERSNPVHTEDECIESIKSEVLDSGHVEGDVSVRESLSGEPSVHPSGVISSPTTQAWHQRLHSSAVRSLSKGRRKVNHVLSVVLHACRRHLCLS